MRQPGELALSFVAALWLMMAQVQAQDLPALFQLGDAAVTGYSGTLEETGGLDPGGASLRVISVAAPGFVWDARVWPATPAYEYAAKDVGQVFGVTFDDAAQPNIYAAASSAYGLHVTGPSGERLARGSKTAQWADGQWGAGGGPGSIWKIDGVTGAVSLFADVTLDGEPNGGAGLGGLAYDAAHRQLFVADLATGMIHLIGLDGAQAATWDHGVDGRKDAKLSPVPHDPGGRLDITSADFDAGDPATWGYAEDDRRVWGLAVHGGRLYYAVTGDSAVWSVALDRANGRFAGGARREVEIPKKPKALVVSDIVFSHRGAMILAQRGDPGKSRLYRFWQDAAGAWIAEPEEYAVGFEPEHRQTSGGIDLGYGYQPDGFMDIRICEAALWSTGDNLRYDNQLKDALAPGGALSVDGLQGMPSGPVKGANAPPWFSFMLDTDPFNANDAEVQGWVGDVAIYRAPCEGGQDGGGNGGGGFYVGPGYQGGVDATGLTELPACKDGAGCEPPPRCARPKIALACDESSGVWTADLTAGTALKADTVKISGLSPGVSIPGGPVLPLSSPVTPLPLNGAIPGQYVAMSLCFFDSAAAAGGKPFDCCKAAVGAIVPGGLCVKK